MTGNENNIEGIYHFWIIHKGSGLTMFSQEFEGLASSSDSDIVGGFLVAILGFAQEMAGQDIDFMQLKDMRISYSIQGDYVMVAITSNSADPDRIRAMLNLVQNKFIEKYSVILAKELHDISKFYDFAKVTEKIFEAETKYLSIIKSRADSLDDYFKNASQEWRELHNKMVEHAYTLGKWSVANKIKINPIIQKDLIAARSKIIERLNNLKDPNYTATGGSWV
jgi:hypothetical protein